MAGGDPQQQHPETVGPPTAGTSSPCSGTPDAEDLASDARMYAESKKMRPSRLSHNKDSKPKTAPRSGARPVQQYLPKVTYRQSRSASAQSGAHLEQNLGPYATAVMIKARAKAAAQPWARARSPSTTSQPEQPEQYEGQQCEYEDAIAH